MSTQTTLDLESQDSGPVECLGQTFSSDEARREHYLKLLAEKLKDPEFRKIEGFPIGEDEDILALSDPPYYTACPNPWIGEFVQHYGQSYNPKELYHREPFAADVSEGKSHPIYNVHSYHTKVPHRAIMRYILHYTEPGDVVYDGFCGTGMTGVAARLCGNRNEVRELGFRVDKDGGIFDEGGRQFSKLGTRRVIMNDLSPIATFIASNYNSPFDASDLEKEAEEIADSVRSEVGWMFETKHDDGSTGRINCVVWSDVFMCSECGAEVIYWDAAVDGSEGKVKDPFSCSSCSSSISKRKSERAKTTIYDTLLGKPVEVDKQVPVLISYTAGSQRHQKKPDECDLATIDKINAGQIPVWVPSDRMMHSPEEVEKWGDRWRAGTASFGYVHQLFTKRNLWVLGEFNERIKSSASRFLLTGILNRSTRMNRIHLKNFFFGGGGWNAGYMKGVLYVSSLPIETSIFEQWEDRLKAAKRASIGFDSNCRPLISTSSGVWKTPVVDAIDYIFLDPPFGSNLFYSELNFLWESWLRVWTENRQEAVESKFQNKDLSQYKQLMVECFSMAYRALKPGRWMTVEFSNTSASVWNAIQTALTEVGFVIANVSALDKKQGSFNAVSNPTSVKQDLVINAYKPNGGLEGRFEKTGHTVSGCLDFLKTHLGNLPMVKARGGELEFITERDPRILYDRMVAFYVGHGVPVPLSSAEFQAEVAEKFPERDGMVFLPDQVAEYDKKRAQMQGVGQMSIFVEDEKSAIDWLRNFLKQRPSVTADITPEFMQQLGASWKKFETRPELSLLLEQNFLQYHGDGDVPSQIHSYLSTQNKDLRNLPKDDARLKNRAKDRWHVPDPAKAVDVESLRNKRLLQEFWELCDDAGINRPTKDSNQPTLPNITPPAKKTGKKKLKEVRTEAVRLGFKECFASKDYASILALASHLPANVIEEDENLQMIYDMAEMRAEG